MDRVGIVNKLFFGSSRNISSESSRDALLGAFESVLKRQKDNGKDPAQLNIMKEALRRERENSAGDPLLFLSAVENLKKNGFKVLEVDTIEHAFVSVLGEIGMEKRIVKSKSNLSKEMRLRERLEEKGIDVVETDIGDRVIQIMDERASHPTGPAAHLKAEDIAPAVSKRFGREVSSKPEELISILKDDIKKAIEGTTIGITGVNAICAMEGAVVMVHNEGNISEITRLKGKHVMLADSNKIYSNLESAMLMVKLQSWFATGSFVTSFINVVGGKSKTADIEKKLFYGIHGPSELVLILIKRKETVEELKDSDYCIGCGGCLLECPVYREKGSSFGSPYKQGGIGVVTSAKREGIGASLENGLYSCVKCHACVNNCPVSIDTPSHIERLREKAATEKDPGIKGKLKPYRMIARSVVLAASGMGFLKKLKPSVKSKVAYFPGCMATLNAPGIKTSVASLIEKLGGSPPSIIEGCCGGIWQGLGFKSEYKAAFDRFLKCLILNTPEKIVVTCPHCYEILWLKNADKLREIGDIEVLRLTEFINGCLKDLPTKGWESRKKYAYHDSCIFGRKLKIYDEPRQLIEKISNADIVSMDKEKDDSLCCGFPLLAGETKVSRRMSQRVMDLAANSGADKLITSGCPGCYYALKNQDGIEVEDISVLMDRTISAY